MVGAIIVFALTYLLVAGRRLGVLRVSRPAAAAAGGAACVLTGVLTPEQAYASIDGDTIVLLISMMILAAHLDHAGFFEWGAAVALRATRSPQRLLTVVVFSAGILSAFLVNDAVCFLMTPIVVRLVRRLRLGGTLFLMALATSANIGSVMTIIGNPQLMIIGSLSDLQFRGYCLAMAPLGLVCLAVTRLLLPRFYPLRPRVSKEARRRAEWLATPFDDADELPADFRRTMAHDLRPALLVKCAISLTLALVGFFAGLNVAWTALAAAGLLLVAAGWEPRAAFRHVDWQLLLFVTGLFVVVGGLRSRGASEHMFRLLEPWFGGEASHQAWVLSSLTFLGCNLFSNIPFVLVASEWMQQLVDPRLGWMILGMASTFAGNLMVISSVANVLVRDRGRAVAEIRFADHLRYGGVITLLTTILGTFWVLGVVRPAG
ncbi:MAG: SLC13 family permease [Candidatus Krumholzibacteriia bacterium]